MTDEELWELAIAMAPTSEHAIIEFGKRVRLETARACADICSAMNDSMENRGYMYEHCASAIRAKFGLKE